MYICLYCNIRLKKGTEKTFREHENGHRHKTNRNYFFKKKYYQWLKIFIMKN